MQEDRCRWCLGRFVCVPWLYSVGVFPFFVANLAKIKTELPLLLPRGRQFAVSVRLPRSNRAGEENKCSKNMGETGVFCLLVVFELDAKFQMDSRQFFFSIRFLPKAWDCATKDRIM